MQKQISKCRRVGTKITDIFNSIHLLGNLLRRLGGEITERNEGVAKGGHANEHGGQAHGQGLLGEMGDDHAKQDEHLEGEGDGRAQKVGRLEVRCIVGEHIDEMFRDAVPVVGTLLIVEVGGAEIIKGEHAQETKRCEQHLLELVHVDEGDSEKLDLRGGALDGMGGSYDVVDDDGTVLGERSILTLFHDGLDGGNLGVTSLVGGISRRNLDNLANDNVLRHLGNGGLAANKEDVVGRHLEGSIIGLDLDILVFLLSVVVAVGKSVDLGESRGRLDVVAELDLVNGCLALALNVDHGISGEAALLEA